MSRKRSRKIRTRHFLLLALVLYIASIFRNQSKLMSNLERTRDMEMARLKKLEREIADLEREIENSDSLQFVEKVAREELGMVKPREIVFIDKNKEKPLFIEP